MSRLGVIPFNEEVKRHTAQAVANSGTDIYNDSATHTGNWKAFVVAIEATINAITDNGASPSTVPTATALPPGLYVSANGFFTSIDLTSGAVAMYRN